MKSGQSISIKSTEIYNNSEYNDWISLWIKNCIEFFSTVFKLIHSLILQWFAIARKYTIHNMNRFRNQKEVSQFRSILFVWVFNLYWSPWPNKFLGNFHSFRYSTLMQRFHFNGNKNLSFRFQVFGTEPVDLQKEILWKKTLNRESKKE